MSSTMNRDVAAILNKYDITILAMKNVTPTRPFRKWKAFKPHIPGQNFAFSFDIDGVIYKSGELCPGAKEAISYLYENKIPFILLTNGGGTVEDARAADMAKKLGVPIHADQLIQAHTPFKEYVGELGDKTVLVLGGVGDRCRQVAEYYGYKNVITTADLITEYPNLYPFNEIHGDYFEETSRPMPRNADGNVQISAIFVYSSPRCWGTDLQILIDCFSSKQGIVGTHSPLNGNTNLPNNGWLQDGQPHIYFANPDITYATNYHLPRICQGTFKLALEGMWTGLTGTKLTEVEHFTQIGKPTQLQFEYGEKSLRRVAGDKDLTQVYMVGDGPRSDIAGANNYESPHGSAWRSILVQTGIHQAGTVPDHIPDVEVENVLEAVRWALKRENITM